MRRQGKDRTDDARLDAMTEEDIEAAARSEGEEEFDWSNAQVGIPESKAQLTLRIDRDVLEWFRAQGRGYQTRMNAVLRSFVEAQRRAHR
jgi:uncharacterized protein (DUF4415 family)